MTVNNTEKYFHSFSIVSGDAEYYLNIYSGEGDPGGDIRDNYQIFKSTRTVENGDIIYTPFELLPDSAEITLVKGTSSALATINFQLDADFDADAEGNIYLVLYNTNPSQSYDELSRDPVSLEITLDRIYRKMKEIERDVGLSIKLSRPPVNIDQDSVNYPFGAETRPVLQNVAGRIVGTDADGNLALLAIDGVSVSADLAALIQRLTNFEQQTTTALDDKADIDFENVTNIHPEAQERIAPQLDPLLRGRISKYDSTQTYDSDDHVFLGRSVYR